MAATSNTLGILAMDDSHNGDGVDWAKGTIIWPPQPQTDEPLDENITTGALEKLLALKPYLAPLFDDPMAMIRHRFAILFPQIPFNSLSLKNALVAECGQSMATVDDLTLSEVADMLGKLQEQRSATDNSRLPLPEVAGTEVETKPTAPPLEMRTKQMSQAKAAIRYFRNVEWSQDHKEREFRKLVQSGDVWAEQMNPPKGRLFIFDSRVIR